jgi:hypothetical protein
MPWKTNEDGQIEVQDGAPVYLYEDGKEAPINVDALMKNVKSLQDENAKRRIKAKELEDLVKPIQDSGIDNVLDFIERSKKNAELVENLKDKDMLDAQQVEKLKRDAVQNVETLYKEKLSTIENRLKATSEEYNKFREVKTRQFQEDKLKSFFDSSDYIREKTNLIPEMAYNTFKDCFKFIENEDGSYTIKAIHKYGNQAGQEILSISKANSEIASPEEAIQQLINGHPHKERMIIAVESGGTGSKRGTYTANQRNYEAITDPVERLKAIRRDQFRDGVFK